MDRNVGYFYIVSCDFTLLAKAKQSKGKKLVKTSFTLTFYVFEREREGGRREGGKNLENSHWLVYS